VELDEIGETIKKFALDIIIGMVNAYPYYLMISELNFALLMRGMDMLPRVLKNFSKHPAVCKKPILTEEGVNQSTC